MFELMGIQNDPDVAEIYDNAGIDRIFIDLEQIGKQERQRNINAVLNFHTLSDIKKVKNKLTHSKLLVRINPIHENSQYEIQRAIDDGADILMLPMFKTMKEIDTFLSLVSGKIKTSLLFETSESICLLSEICKIKEFNEIYVGLNDMHLSLKMAFLFEPLTYGIVDLFSKFSKQNNKTFGFGGMATLDGGLIPGKQILAEHVRLNSNCVILSRSFFKPNIIEEELLHNEIKNIRSLYKDYKKETPEFFNQNQISLREKINNIIRN